jgi:serine O-acetyltransferase
MDQQVSMDTEIEKIAACLITGFAPDNLKRSGVPKHPVKSVILDIIKKLQHALFPGYFEDSQLRSAAMKYQLCSLLEEILSELTEQVCFALRFSAQFQAAAQEEIERKAAAVSLEFISRLPVVKEYLETDIEAAYEGDPAAFSKSEIIISYPGIYAGMVYRLAHELYLLQIPLIPRIMTEHAHSVTGIDIHPGAAIGKYFFMDHGTGIVIGETTVIGSHVKIYQGVTLGALSTSGGQKLKNIKRHPTIYDYVTIYSGASILGGETVIGEKVVIGGNAFVIKSIPEKTKVSVKSPELLYKNGGKSVLNELNQDDDWFYMI